MAKTFTSRPKGLDKLLAQLKARKADYISALAGALYEEGEESMAEFKQRVPVDEGILRASGHVLPPETEGTDVTVTMGFGGPAGTGNQGGTNPEDVGYAVHVHEDLNAHHTVGQAKYVEQPLAERKPSMTRRLARRIRQRLSNL